MNKLDEILSRLYLSLGFTKDSEFCKKYDIKANTLSTWKKRGKIPYELIEEISQNENISLDWLINGRGTKSLDINGNDNVIVSGHGSSISGSFNAKKKNKKIKKEDIQEIVSIPYFQDTYASAGHGAINYDEMPHPMSFDKNFLQRQFGIVSFKNLHIINAIGNSMEPTFKEGELLMINPFENESMNIKDGGIYVISCNNSILVKRIKHNPINGKVTLISDNKEYEDIPVEKNEFESCTIIGRVVGHFDRI